MKISIVNRNCDFDKHFLISESTNGSIEIHFCFDRIVTSQSKKKIRESLTQLISRELQKFKWLIVGKVQIEIDWFIDSITKQETDKIGDLDNITKPFLDILCGEDGILVDDSQINSMHTSWTSKNSSVKGNRATLKIYFNNDCAIFKQDLCFFQISEVVYTPINFKLDNKQDVKAIKILLDSIRERRKDSENLNHRDFDIIGQYLIRSEYIFHRTRLNGFSKEKIISKLQSDKMLDNL